MLLGSKKCCRNIHRLRFHASIPVLDSDDNGGPMIDVVTFGDTGITEDTTCVAPPNNIPVK